MLSSSMRKDTFLWQDQSKKSKNLQMNEIGKLANYVGGREEDKMILAFFDPVCRGIFRHQSTEALSPLCL